MSRREWFGGALVLVVIGLIGVGAPGERKAGEIVDRLGGEYFIEPRFGLDCLGVIVKINLTECAPSISDLEEIKHLRHLRILDLSRTPIGDRELVQLVDSPCQLIIVPDGQISEKVRSMFSEDQLVLGIGISEFTLPGTKALSLSADLTQSSKGSSRATNEAAAKRALVRAKRRRAGGKSKAAAAHARFATLLVMAQRGESRQSPSTNSARVA